MSASPPFLTQRPYDSLSILEACQQEPFGNELLQVDTSLVTRLDPVIVQCSRYSSPQYKEVKGYKSYGTDKGRLLYLSAYTREQTCHGYIKLSRQEQITILFLMALYRPDKEGRSSEPVADAVETCSTNEHSDSDSPQQPSTPDYIMNRHGLSADQNLVEEIHNKISLIKDNVSKYFTADFDKGNDCYYYYNTLLVGQDYTNETVFIDLIPKITTKTKTAPKLIFGRVKPEGRTTLKKRRTTISQTPVNRNIAPHLASAENHQIRKIPTEPAALDNGNLAVYPQQPTPSYEGEYHMDEYSTPNFTPVNNFGQIQQQISQPMPNVAHQGPSAYGAYGSVNVTHLYNTINMLLGMFETATGKSYSEYHFALQQPQLDVDVDELFGEASTEQYHSMNMPAQQVTMAHPQQLQGFPQFSYSNNNNNVRFEHQNNTHSSSG